LTADAAYAKLLSSTEREMTNADHILIAQELQMFHYELENIMKAVHYKLDTSHLYSWLSRCEIAEA
jgi:hypothetical protein